MKNLTPESNVVFTDVRFPNEAAAVKALGGQVWRVDRPGLAGIGNHASETALADWHFDKWILNDAGIEDLGREVDYHLNK